MKALRILTVVCAVVFAAGSFFSVSHAGVPVAGAAPADPAFDATLELALKRLLKENPDLVLDVLRTHSEVVLEVAQQGNILRKRKGMIAQWTQDAKIPKDIVVTDTFMKGAPDAPVTIVAFSDFTCAFCRQAEEALAPLLVKYKGKVRFVFKPLPKEDMEISYKAALYASAAFAQGMDKGWAYYEVLFAQMEELEKGGENFLKAQAAKQGLDLKRLATDLASKKIAEPIAKARGEAGRLDIHGTPYFFVNDLVIRGAVPKELFEEAIEMALSLKK